MALFLEDKEAIKREDIFWNLRGKWKEGGKRWKLRALEKQNLVAN